MAKKDKSAPLAAKSQSPEATASGDRYKWALIFLILLTAVVTNYLMRDLAWALQAAAGIVLVMLLLGVAGATSQGQRAWGFIKSSKTELRKVVWPTRPETIQTTLVVVAMVVVIAIILWGVDSLFYWGVSWLTGQRG